MIAPDSPLIAFSEQPTLFSLPPTAADTQDAVKRVFSNNRHSNKISWKRKQAVQLSMAIKEYLQRFDVALPPSYKEFKAMRKEIMHYDLYEDGLYKEMRQLVKLYYDLRISNKAIYAVFSSKGKMATQLLACWYSKNRLDPVWNYRKSQLIRKVWHAYLKQSDLYRRYRPAHLVLTVPHKDGLWKGKRFYAHLLLEAYNLLRRDKQFKKFVFGGEYGLECKASKDKNGLHIHIHSLLFVHPKYSLNEVREWMEQRWRAIVGNESGYSGIHFEQLYCYKRDEQGRYICEQKEVVTGAAEVQDEDGDFSFEAVTEQKQVRKKFRVGTDSPLEEYVSGVMECMKYHFKPDCLEQPDGTYDIELVKDILNHTQGLRMYSRFGGLYKEKQLDFSRPQRTAPQQGGQEPEEELMASLDGVQESLINPLTYAPAQLHQYRLAISCPEFFSHRPKDYFKPCEPIVRSTEGLYFIERSLSLKEAMACLAKGEYRRMLSFEDYQRLMVFVHTG